MEKVRKVKFNSFKDDRGVLTAIELKDYTDWGTKRVYYVTDVTAPRGGHAVKGEQKIYVCQKGNIKARFHDGDQWLEFELEGPDDGLVMSGPCFREFYNFSDGAVLMAISSVNYVPEDYIYDLDEFINFVKQ